MASREGLMKKSEVVWRSMTQVVHTSIFDVEKYSSGQLGSYLSK